MWLTLLLACPATSTGEPPPPPSLPSPEPPPRRVVLVAAGDVLPHRRVKKSAADHGWTDVFGSVAPLVRQADVAFANLESPVAPDAHKGLHGEVFNAPATLLDGLVEAGFDVVAMANNHVFDQGPDGLVETWTRARAAGLAPIGAGPTCADARSATVMDLDGVRVAFLAAADLVNADLNADDDQPCLFTAGPECTSDCGPDRDAVHFSIDTERLVSAVRSARDGADIVVVSFHWGDEYRDRPLPEYPVLAQALVGAGADVIVGHHPHVLQPVEIVTAPDGRRAVVAFSLGNLVSDMSRERARDGALLAVAFEVGEATVLDDVRVIPTWTDNQPDRIRVLPHRDLEPELRSARLQAIETVVNSAFLSDALP